MSFATHNEWNRPQTNQNFMNPTRVVGDVLFNGIIDKTQVINAIYNQNPLYPMPSGMTIQDIETVRKGEIVYRIIDNSGGSISTNYNNTGDNTTVCALSSLNGQGTKGDTNIMSKILPIGLSYMETEFSKEARFNIHVGGIHTTINNGPDVINAGDWVMAYAPTLDEVNMQSGGRGKIADKNRLITLWFKPYRTKEHRMTSKQIYNCLKDENNIQSSYLPSYKTACKSLVDACIDISMVIINTANDQGLLGNLNSPNKEEVYTNLMKRLGHSEYMEKNDKSGKSNASATRSTIIDRLFVPYSGNSNLLFDKKSAALNRSQSDSIGLFLESNAVFYHDVEKNIIGKAVTSARPKDNFNIQLRSYST